MPDRPRPRTVALALDREGGVEIVAPSADVDEAAHFAEGHHLERILLDTGTPADEAFAALAEIRLAVADVEVVLVPTLIDLRSPSGQPVLVFEAPA